MVRDVISCGSFSGGGVGGGDFGFDFNVFFLCD